MSAVRAPAGARPGRSRRRPPRSMKIEQHPDMLVAFDDACSIAFSEYFGWEIPKAVVVRAFERVLIQMAEEVANSLPGVGSIHRGRPQMQDREAWHEIELEIADRFLRMWRNRPLRNLKPAPAQASNF